MKDGRIRTTTYMQDIRGVYMAMRVSFRCFTRNVMEARSRQTRSRWTKSDQSSLHDSTFARVEGCFFLLTTGVIRRSLG